MGTAWWGLEKAALRNRLILSVDSPEGLRRLKASAEGTGAAASIHIKVDTGMGRLGVRWDGMEPLLEAVREAGRVRLKGVFSHLSSADDQDPLYTLVQRRRFERALGAVRKAGLDPGEIHLANSAGLLYYKSLRRWSARCGLGIYGYAPDPRRSPLGLRPVLSLKTRIGSVRALRRGEPTGYGRLFSASRSSRIGILPVGYADGFSRRFSNRGRVIIGDRWARIAGAVSMDMTAVDITDLPEVQEGDEVILLGSSPRCRLTAREWSDTLRTVPYEVLCGIAGRVPRICVRKE
jgi:alanine racemase